MLVRIQRKIKLHKMVQSLWKVVYSFLKKLKIELIYDPAISFLGIYPMEMKSGSQRDICTPMFTANDKSRQCLKIQKHHFADKGLYSKSYGFTSSNV